MTQSTRNHSMEFLLSVAATTVTRKVLLLYHHSVLLGWGEGAGHMLLKNKHAFTLTVLQLGQPRIPSVSMEPQTKARTRRLPHARQSLLSSQVANPEGWCWALAESPDITGRSTCLDLPVPLGSIPNLLSQKLPATDTFSSDICWKQQAFSSRHTT